LLAKYGSGKFKIGEDDDSRKLKVTMKEYIEYLLYNRDDSPLYLFESSLEDHKYGHSFMREYQPPIFFRQNLFGLLKEDEMPPHRWFLMGPKRSGSEIH
jgi:histone arginine demethylase JMJD6